jgi:hypothetical protein
MESRKSDTRLQKPMSQKKSVKRKSKKRCKSYEKIRKKTKIYSKNAKGSAGMSGGGDASCSRFFSKISRTFDSNKHLFYCFFTRS